MFSVSREITFCYGHRLLNYSGKCRHLHGHNGKAIITLAHSMHMRVVAEGVETAAQLAFLEQHGCEEYQGYFFSPPVPAATLERLALATTKP